MRTRTRLGALIFAGTLVLAAPLGSLPHATAAPAAAVLDPKVNPHYFGPWPNWANSPLTMSKAAVTITGAGTGATAVAQVDPTNGGIKSIDVTSPGHDYVDGTTAVTITGGTTDATATATVSASGVVIGFTAVTPGSGYTSFNVALAGSGTGATAIGSGGVDSFTITDGGSGYVMPTVDFDMPDDPNGVQAKAHVPMIVNGDPIDGMNANGTITAVVVDEPGSGYTTAPAAAILNGTQFDPITLSAGGHAAVVTTTLALSAVNVVDFGSGYASAPTVTITDPTGAGTGAAATAVSDVGGITGIAVVDHGSGYLTKGMKKFIDDLPGTCTPPACPTDPTAKFIPTAVPANKLYKDPSGQDIAADEYVIGLIQYRTKFSSDLPGTGALVRAYVQLETPDNTGVSQHVRLQNELMDGTKVDVAGGYLGVTSPQYLGPFINATKNKPVRVVFRNLLPTGSGGDLYLPTDSTMMGAGVTPSDMMPVPTNDGTVLDQVRSPECTTSPKPESCFKDNRATLHLHGGITPWISDGTPHQWITPANETTMWPQGVSVQNVPDMTDGLGAVTCAAADDGCETFFYTNQQSARLVWYHDHSWGITRLNVYAGEAAGYAITDATEQSLITRGLIPGAADTIPLIVQDKTFVPGDEQLKDTVDGAGNITRYGQDPTWDSARMGKPGDLWYHHVYMPAQNPGDPSGMSAYGRWMYGPWFWPPATGTKYGPIANPYYDANCKLDIPATWTYQTDPFCEPELIPGTPNISAGMEQFNDTPLVNGVAYPKATLEPKTYRFRILNGANDRFFNLQWYTADPTQGDGTTEVALKPSELLAAQTDPNVSPTPVDSNSTTAGPDWVQIANEGGFLPAPAVIDGQQPTTWITDPTRFDVGNVDKHSMLLAPAERSDVIVDFSKFAGKTLILYNDAPAAFPARVATYDYYTGAPDLSPSGAPTILPGYGPNTRTVMQVTIAGTPAPAFDLTKLKNAFKHNAGGTGVFESGQHPVIVGQAAYNSAYGTSFAASSNCNGGSTSKSCDGLVRINDLGMNFGFNTLKAPTAKSTVNLEPKALHDEMNSSTFDEYGRMQANLGIEAQPPTPGLQNVTLYPYVNPPTELIDGTNLPKADVTYGSDGLPVSDVKIAPMSSDKDGTQLWRITHNGVDTHPIHFHLYDVQVLNRVTWDNIIIQPDANELGWKDTIRVSPLEDTIVALRPIIPEVPFEVPNSIRMLNPMDAAGSQALFNNIDVNGNPTAAITNQLVNFGWEYVYHCHILSHEEMDMMRPMLLAVPPRKPDGTTLAVTGTGNNARIKVTWNDNSITETSFLIQRTTDNVTWTNAGSSVSPLNQPNIHGSRTFTDPTADPTAAYLYRVVALNAVGYGGAFPGMTVQSMSATVAINPPAAPTTLAATIQAGPKVSLTWRDNATSEAGFTIQRSSDAGVTFTQAGTAPARAGTGNVTWVDSAVTAGLTYQYRVVATNIAGSSSASNTVSVALVLPGTPTITSGTAVRQGGGEVVTVRWTDVANETGYTIQWSSTSAFTTVAGSGSAAANATTFVTGTITRQGWFFRMRSTNLIGTSAWSAVRTVAIAP
jgi:FtsP/CotA-like multicopper oxidase with cupredoxin domain